MINKSIGLILSGGGARAAAHIGVLQALNENGIHPTHVSGASAGALIGALYCSGYTPMEILKLSLDHEYLKIFRIGFMNKRLTDMTRLKEFLHIHIPDDDFKKLHIPLFISVSNLNSGMFEIKSEEKLIECIAASCAIPLLFKPININGNDYVDGGVLNNLPVEPLQNICNKIIGVSVCAHEPRPKIRGVKEIAERCLQLAIWNTMSERILKCNIAIEIEEAFSYSIFSMKKSEKLFEIGYKTAISRMEEISKTLSS